MDRLEKEYYDHYRNSIPPSLKGLIKENLVDAKTAEILRKGIRYFDAELSAELRGKMDDCLIDSKGNLVPLDNKTANPENEELVNIYQLQLDSYTFLLQQNGYKTAEHGYLIYYTPEAGNPHKGIIFRTDVKRLQMHPKRIFKVFRDAVKLLRKPSPPKFHKDCKMCEWLRQIGEM